MKLLVFAVLFSILATKCVRGSESSRPSLEQAVDVVIGGNFAVDHLGPDNFALIKTMIVQNAAEADQILIDKYLKHPAHSRGFSSISIPSLLWLTVHLDPKGVSQAAGLYQQALNARLIEFDTSPDQSAFLQNKTEEDRNNFRRLIERRKELEEIERKLPNHDAERRRELNL